MEVASYKQMESHKKYSKLLKLFATQEESMNRIPWNMLKNGLKNTSIEEISPFVMIYADGKGLMSVECMIYQFIMHINKLIS